MIFPKCLTGKTIIRLLQVFFMASCSLNEILLLIVHLGIPGYLPRVLLFSKNINEL